MRTAAIIVKKDQSERIYEIIHNLVTGHQYELEHTGFAYYDDREVCVIILKAKAEVLQEVKNWLNGEFSSSAFWMQSTITGSYPMLG